MHQIGKLHYWTDFHTRAAVMRAPRVLLSLGICFTLLAATISFTIPSAVAEDVGYPFRLGPQGNISCPAPQSCTAIDSGESMSIVIWNGSGNAWESGMEIDFTADPVNKKILEDNKIIGVGPFGLTCMSVGNCIAFVGGSGDSTQKEEWADATKKRQYSGRDTLKPFRTIFFSISQIDSKWQAPVHIENLAFTHNTDPAFLSDHAIIYCESHGNCVVAGNSGGPSQKRVDSYWGYRNLSAKPDLDTKPFVISQVNGKWGAPEFPMAKKLENQGAVFYTLKCTSTVNCVSQGIYLPSKDFSEKLKKLNNFKPSAKYPVPLGFTMNLVDGKWEEPQPNLAGMFRKGPFPSGDLKIYTRFAIFNNIWNSRTNMMPCIIALNCRIGAISAEGQIQPAGIGDPTWPVKCPRSVDTVRTPQLKVLGFKFNGEATYSRLEDGAYSPSKQADDLIGCYAQLSEFIPNPEDVNFYQIGTINRDATGYYWQNASGSRLRLTLSGSILTTDKSNTKEDQGQQFILITEPEELVAERQTQTPAADQVIQPAGIGDASWAVKCPAVVDTVKTPQAKISGFKFDGTGQTFTRLADGTSMPSKQPENVIGCYANLYDFNANPKTANAWQIGSINRDALGYYWVNAAGVRWGLTVSGSNLVTDRNNPYYATGRQFVTFS